MALSQQQLTLRRAGIGASELFDVIDDPYRVFHRKITGKSAFTGQEEFIRLGNLLERPTADDYAYRRAQSGSPVRLLQTQTSDGGPVTLQDPNRPWFLGTPDFLPALERVGGFPLYVPDLEALWRMRDAGQLDRGLEIKTGAAVAEVHLEDVDKWGGGYRAQVEDVVALLNGRCEDPSAVARDLIARFSLQHHVGAATNEDEEYGWGDAGTSQMPRRYYAQCVGYMALTGLDRWDLHRLRFGYGRLETVTYTILRDLELEGLLLQAAERFIRDHMHPIEAPDLWTPPKPKDIESGKLELARLFPRENGRLRPADRTDAVILEAYREAVIEQKRADVKRELIELLVKQRIGEDKGIDARSSGLGNVSWGRREGKTLTDGHAAVRGLCDRLTDWIPPNELQPLALAALAEATTQGEPYRQISRPQTWTKGLENEVRLELAAGGTLPALPAAESSDG